MVFVAPRGRERSEVLQRLWRYPHLLHWLVDFFLGIEPKVVQQPEKIKQNSSINGSNFRIQLSFFKHFGLLSQVSKVSKSPKSIKCRFNMFHSQKLRLPSVTRHGNIYGSRISSINMFPSWGNLVAHHKMNHDETAMALRAKHVSLGYTYRKYTVTWLK